jgi:hypothetical protein
MRIALLSVLSLFFRRIDSSTLCALLSFMESTISLLVTSRGMPYITHLIVFESLGSETITSQVPSLWRPRAAFFCFWFSSLITKPPLANGLTDSTVPIDFSMALANRIGLHAESLIFGSVVLMITLKFVSLKVWLILRLDFRL